MIWVKNGLAVPTICFCSFALRFERSEEFRNAVKILARLRVEANRSVRAPRSARGRATPASCSSSRPRRAAGP